MCILPVCSFALFVAKFVTLFVIFFLFWVLNHRKHGGSFAKENTQTCLCFNAHF